MLHMLVRCLKPVNACVKVRISVLGQQPSAWGKVGGMKVVVVLTEVTQARTVKRKCGVPR